MALAENTYTQVKILLQRISNSGELDDWETPMISKFPNITPVTIVAKLLNIEETILVADLIEAKDYYEKVVHAATILNRIRNEFEPWKPGDPIPADWFEPIIRGGSLTPIHMASLILNENSDGIISNLLTIVPPVELNKEILLSKEDLCIILEAEIRLIESDYIDIQKHLKEIANYTAEIRDIEYCLAAIKEKVCHFIYESIIYSKEKGLTIKEIREKCNATLNIHDIPFSLIEDCITRLPEVILDEKHYKLKAFYIAPMRSLAWDFKQKNNGDHIVENFVQSNTTFIIKKDVLESINTNRFNRKKAGCFIHPDLFTLLKNEHDLTNYLYTILEGELADIPKIMNKKQYLTVTCPISYPIGWAEYIDLWYADKLHLNYRSGTLYPRHTPSYDSGQRCKVISSDNMLDGQKLRAPMINKVSLYLIISITRNKIDIVLDNIYPGDSIGEINNPATFKYTVPRIGFFSSLIDGEPYPELPITKLLDPLRKTLRNEVIERKKRGEKDRIILHQLGISIKTLNEIRNTANEEEKRFFYGGRDSKSPDRTDQLVPNILRFIHRQSYTPLATRPNKWIELSEIVRYFTLGSEFPNLLRSLSEIPELELDASAYTTKYRDSFIICDAFADIGGIVAVDFALNSSSKQPARRDFNKLSDKERQQTFERCLKLCKEGIADNPPEVFLDRIIGDIYHEDQRIEFYNIGITKNLRAVGFIDPRSKVLYLTRIFYGSAPSSHIREIAKQHLQRMVK